MWEFIKNSEKLLLYKQGLSFLMEVAIDSLLSLPKRKWLMRAQLSSPWRKWPLRAWLSWPWRKWLLRVHSSPWSRLSLPWRSDYWEITHPLERSGYWEPTVITWKEVAIESLAVIRLLRARLSWPWRKWLLRAWLSWPWRKWLLRAHSSPWSRLSSLWRSGYWEMTHPLERASCHHLEGSGYWERLSSPWRKWLLKVDESRLSLPGRI